MSFQLENAVARWLRVDGRVRASHRRIIERMAHDANQRNVFERSVSGVAAAVGSSERAVERATREARSLGLIRVRRQFNGPSAYQFANPEAYRAGLQMPGPLAGVPGYAAASEAERARLYRERKKAQQRRRAEQMEHAADVRRADAYRKIQERERRAADFEN
jgi:hypothetical protein